MKPGRLVVGPVVALLLALFLVPTAPSLAQAGPQISVEVQPRTVREGESVQVTILVRGAQASNASINPRAPEGEKLRPAGSFSTSHQISSINGRQSATTTFRVDYLATARGAGRVPAFAISFDGQTRRTDPVAVKILPPAAPGEESDDTGLSIRARLSRSKVFLGESLVLEYVLRTRVRVVGYDPERLEQLAGFLIEDQPISPDSTLRTTTDKQGRSVNEFTLFRRVLVPTRTGRIEIPSVVFTFGVQSNQRRRRSLFFEPQIDRVARLVPQRSVEVMPLPEEGRPADFTGAVGRFRLEAALDSDKAVAGQAVSLTVTLRGQGVLGTISPPLLDLPPDLQAYDPQEESAGPSAKRWIYPLVPRTAGSMEIPRVHMSAFEPRAAEYQTLEQGPFSLDVSAGRDDGGQTGVSSVGGAVPVRAQASDLRFIQPIPDTLRSWIPSVGDSALFWTGVLFPLIALPLLLVGGGIFGRYSVSAAGRRARSARRVSSLLRSAGQQAASDSAEAARDLLRAIHAWASELLGVASRPLERAQLRRALTERTKDPDLAETVVALIDRAEGVRYGGAGEEQTIVTLIEEVRALTSERRTR